jgi:hypothetical protein
MSAESPAIYTNCTGIANKTIPGGMARACVHTYMYRMLAIDHL